MNRVKKKNELICKNSTERMYHSNNHCNNIRSTFEEEMGHLMHKFRSGWQNTVSLYSCVHSVYIYLISAYIPYHITTKMESSMEDYEEQRLKLAEKAEALQSRLNLLRAQIQAECSKKDTADTTPQSTLDQVR